MKISSPYLFVLFIGLACAHPKPEMPKKVTKGDYSYTKQYATWLIEEKMKKEDVVGMSVALVDDQDIVWSQGFGFADAESKLPATADTVYRAGSISKLFTALAVMQLAEQGKIDIDHPITEYLPEFSVKSRFEGAPPITSRMLMTHHSGLFGDYFNGMLTPNPKPVCSLLSEIKNDYVAYPPNFLLAYSNTGVSILGCAVEKIVGRGFESHINETLLATMGMEHSVFIAEPPATKAYEGKKLREELPIRDTPAGGLNTTVNDLGQLMKMVFAGGKLGDKQIIARETLSQMFEAQNTKSPLDLDAKIGLAWFLSGPKIPGATKLAFHDGATLYHRALFLALPDQKLGVILLSNSIEGGEVEMDIAADILRVAIAAKAGVAPQEATPSQVNPPSQTLRSLEGQYASASGYLEIEKKRKKYVGTINHQKLILTPQKGGTYKTKIRLLRLIPFPVPLEFFLQEIEGHETLILQGQRRQLFAEKIPPSKESAAWKKREGEYIPSVPKGEFAFLTSLTLEYNKDGSLLAYLKAPGERKVSPFLLEVTSDNEAFFAGLGRHLGETIRVVTKDGKEVLRYQGYDWQASRLTK